MTHYPPRIASEIVGSFNNDKHAHGKIEGMEIYQSSAARLTGKTYIDLERKARKIHNDIARRTKRSPYLRSVYFKKQKIFIKPFWEHLNQKSQHDRRRRLKYYGAEIDLLQHSTQKPITKQNPNGDGQLVHRFVGKTKEGDLFFVQIKEHHRTNARYFMSVFGAR